MTIMKWRYWYLGFSALLLSCALGLLLTKGLRLGVDFTGGSLLEVRLEQDVESSAALEEKMLETYAVEQVQAVGDNQYQIRGPEIDQARKAEVLAALRENYGWVQELRFESVGPTISGELLQKTLIAIALVAGMIMFYVWHQFDELRFGICAILAMFHDSLILIGSFSLLGYLFGAEIDVLFVTALLTTLSFSIHDTIVVYDRIRELRRKHPKQPFPRVVNTAVVETLGRSLNNSITIILVLFALALLGGSTIQWFAVALLIGAITGTYSSTFTAAPLLLVWEEWKDKRDKSDGASNK